VALLRCRSDLRGSPLHPGHPFRRTSDHALPMKLLPLSAETLHECSLDLESPQPWTSLSPSTSYSSSACSVPRQSHRSWAFQCDSSVQAEAFPSARTPVCPSVVCPVGVHSRVVRRMTPRSSAPRCYLRRLVPPPWSLTTSTVFSTDRLASLLHPASDPEVRFVSVCRPTRHPSPK
jgi:hypothetical protein